MRGGVWTGCWGCAADAPASLRPRTHTRTPLPNRPAPNHPLSFRGNDNAQEYRGGMTRASYIDERRRRRRAAGLPDSSGLLFDDDVLADASNDSSRRRAAEAAVAAGESLVPQAPGLRPDGSFRGPRGGGGKGSGPAGLGFSRLGGGPAPPGLEGSYEAYRRQRSGAYHEFVQHCAATGKSNMARGGR